MIHGETIHSAMPQDLPWWSPDHSVFFGVLYLVILVLASGIFSVFYRTVRDCARHATKTSSQSPDDIANKTSNDQS